MQKIFINLLLLTLFFYITNNQLNAKVADTTTSENYCKDTDHDPIANKFFETTNCNKLAAENCCGERNGVLDNVTNDKRFCGCLIKQYGVSTLCATEVKKVFSCPKM
ncbi:hypothetical protein Mgra_00009726 [Meloidogyne graminicola]|uniref:Uncharacterized protein n=1 Tax=Meloidogyne graminicola TaxID=189291 RepID=A0A8S9Z996_9BILA|nr:hypothetical protein Mgra_00009726 [Meloidogyne graminicola]